MEKRAAFSRHATSWNSLWDASVKRSSNSHKQRRLLCILSQHCSWKLIAHLSPPPPHYCDISNLSQPMTGLMIMFPVLFQPQITANSVITGLLCQPSSGPLTGCWPSSRLLTTPVCLGRGPGALENQELQKKTTTENCNSATVHHGRLIATVLVVNSRVLILSLLFFFWNISHWGPHKTGDYHRFNLRNRSDDTWTRSHCFDLILFHSFTQAD